MSDEPKDVLMKDLFTKKYSYFFVNKHQKDPCLYLVNNLTGRACLFDLGEIHSLSGRNLLKVDTVFISHTHMDHFIGFDDLLRINIPSFKLKTLVGPKGIADQVYHRIASYSWNLLEKDQVQFLVKEITSNEVKTFLLSNTTGFIPQPVNASKDISSGLSYPVLSLDNQDEIYAVILDHGIDSIGYLYKTASKFKVDTSKLESLGASQGKWIGELISKVESAQFEDYINVELKDGTYSRMKVETLYHRILEVIPPRSFGYITDFYFSESNLKKLKSLFYGVDLLFSESTFMDEDYKKARLKKHLTTRQAALIGSALKVHKMNIFHFSRSYPDEKMVETEFNQFFDRFKTLDSSRLDHLIQEELQRIKE